jgi:hypothetical protein
LRNKPDEVLEDFLGGVHGREVCGIHAMALTKDLGLRACQSVLFVST